MDHVFHQLRKGGGVGVGVSSTVVSHICQVWGRVSWGQSGVRAACVSARSSVAPYD